LPAGRPPLQQSPHNQHRHPSYDHNATAAVTSMSSRQVNETGEDGPQAHGVSITEEGGGTMHEVRMCCRAFCEPPTA
jgi:hypothetical protein